MAESYCESYEFQNKQQPVPMKKVFCADINKIVPTNDCYIMAQATIEGLLFLTGNGKDYVFNEKDADKTEYNRTRGIIQVNIKNGYFTINEKGFNVTSKPILLRDLGPILKNIEKLQVPELIGGKTKSDTILI